MAAPSVSPATGRVVAAVLERHGRTFAQECGIRVEKNTPSPLFRLLCLSLLASARISAETATSASKALAASGWTTAEKMASASWEDRTQVLNRSGYARYDESTSRYLGSTAQMVLDRYRGDLRRLREQSAGDVDVISGRLTDFTGIGDVGAGIFLREVQVAWTEYVPFADERVLAVSERLGLGSSAKDLFDLVGDSTQFVRLVAGLVRVEHAHDEERIGRVQ